MDERSVIAISTTLGGPSTFVIASSDSPDRERVVSSSVVIQDALLLALLSGARPVQLDLVPETDVIKRVNAFAPGELVPIPFAGEFNVSRIATQRKPDGTDEHLEVFLRKIGDTEEKAFNVYDPFLQHILIAAFRSVGPPPGVSPPVDVQFDGDDIVTVTLGENGRAQLA